MEIVAIEQLGREKWDSFVAHSDQAWFFHFYDLIAAKATWPRHANDSFALLDDQKQVLAVMPLHRIGGRRKKIIPYDIANSLGGIVMRNDVIGTKRVEKIWEFCLSHIAALYQKAPVKQLEMWLSPMAPALRGERCPLVNPLVPHGMTNALTQTWVVDLSRGEDALRAATAKGFREALKKAEANGALRIREARPDADDLARYYTLHETTCSRSALASHPRAYFDAIWNTLLPDGKCKILFAEENGEVVSAINYAVAKDACAYWTGASSQRALDLCANHLLHWTMLLNRKAEGCRWAEIGEAVFASDNSKHVAISDFKSRMGGDLYPYYKGFLSRQGLDKYAGH